jgi:hypothetical protein
MALIDQYNFSNAAGKIADPIEAGGLAMLTLQVTVAKAASDSNGSIYRLFNLPKTAIPLAFAIDNDALSGATAWDLGLYRAGVGGAAINKNQFLANMDFSATNNVRPGTRFRINFNPLAAGGSLANGTVYKTLIVPGKYCRLVDVKIIQSTVVVGGTNTLQVLQGSSAGTTMLSAATFDPTTISGANQATSVPLSATPAALIVNASGAGSGVYVAYTSGTQGTAGVDTTISLEFEELTQGSGTSDIIQIADANKALWELAGDTLIASAQYPTYDIALTADTAGGAAGNIKVRGTFAMP